MSVESKATNLSRNREKKARTSKVLAAQYLLMRKFRFKRGAA
nr:MAG TPA: hypothetical protein [Caudoviricetes sp.]